MRYQVKDEDGNIIKGYFNLSKLLVIKDVQEPIKKERKTYRTKFKQAELNFLEETKPK